jgi:DNA-binding CsgD family transcriptional regulator
MMYLFGFAVLCLATVMNLLTKIPFISIIPCTKYTEACINGICALLCLYLVFRPENIHLQYHVFIIEAASTTLIGFVGIGTLLFSALITLQFINGYFIMHRERKIAVLAAYWCAVTAGIYPAFGLRPFLFEIALTLFYFAFFATVYEKLRTKLSYLLPETAVTEKTVILPEHGSALSLSRYGLSERQITFIHRCIDDGLTYEQIAEKYNVSISVVKKDMANACRIFGVKNREALRVLLLQYVLK